MSATTTRDILMLDLLPTPASLQRGAEVLAGWMATPAERKQRANAGTAATAEADWDWLESGAANGLEVIEHQVPIELLAALFSTGAPQRGAMGLQWA